MLKSLILVSSLIVASSAFATLKKSSPLGIVEGIRDCGAHGKLGTVEITDCTSSPCHFKPHTIYDVAVRFISSETSNTLVLGVFVSGDRLLNLPIDGNIEGGIEYELKFQIPVSRELAGTEHEVLTTILDYDNNRLEICALLDVIVLEEESLVN